LATKDNLKWEAFLNQIDVKPRADYQKYLLKARPAQLKVIQFDHPTESGFPYMKTAV
jgi:hypothetical protein